MFYASLGECITSWAAIERELFELFHRALGVECRWQTKSRKNPDKEKSALLFWTFPTFGTPLSYTSMLVTYCLETADGSKTKPQKYWKKLRDDLEELHSFRNKLAHQPTAENRVIEDDEGTVLIWAKEMIIPNKLDKKKSFKPIEQADLDAHLLSVSAICRKLESTYVNFPGWEEIASEVVVIVMIIWSVVITKTGSRTAGPDLPNHEGGGDTFANLLPNGNVFFQTNPPGTSEDAATRANARYASIRNRTMHPLSAEAEASQQSTCNLGIYRAYEFDGTKLTPEPAATFCGQPDTLLLPTGDVMMNGQVIYKSTGHCHIAMGASAKRRRFRVFQAAATAVRHVSIATARSARCVLAEVR
jgi:hypothetical protein